MSAAALDSRTVTADPAPTLLGRIRTTRLLTASEERDLAKRIELGEISARRTLVEANLRLVLAIARRYRWGATSLDDLFQAGALALVQAVDRYDHRRNLRFSTYAVWLIEGAVVKAAACESSLIRVPHEVAARLGQLRRVESELRQRQGSSLTTAEVAAHSGLSANVLQRLECLPRAELGFEEPVRHSITTDPNDERILLRIELTRALNALSERERQIIALRFGLGKHPQLTLQEIGDRMGLSCERVRQLQEKALEELRHQLADDAKETSAAPPLECP